MLRVQRALRPAVPRPDRRVQRVRGELHHLPQRVVRRAGDRADRARARRARAVPAGQVAVPAGRAQRDRGQLDRRCFCRCDLCCKSC